MENDEPALPEICLLSLISHSAEFKSQNQMCAVYCGL